MTRTVLITDAERGSALAIVRSLGRAGWRVVAASRVANAMSFRSRFADATLVCPDPRDDPAAFVECLVRAADEHDLDLVIPVTEDALYPLARARDSFPRTTLAIASPEALAIVTDKNRTMDLARRVGVPVPDTHFVETLDDIAALNGSLRWPLVVKPQSSRSHDASGTGLESLTVSYASDHDTVVDQIQQANGRYGFLLQTYCPGEGHGVEMLVDHGEPIAAFQHRRLAEVPVTGGASALRESVPLDPQLLDYATRLVRAIEWTGLIMVEFKVGSEPVLMEINGRVWGSLPLASHAGMDFPARWADLCMAQQDRAEPVRHDAVDTSYETGVRAHNPDLMLVWLGSVLRGRRTIVPTPPRLAAVRMLRALTTSRSDYSAADDPRPARGTFRRLTRKLAGKLVGRRPA